MITAFKKSALQMGVEFNSFPGAGELLKDLKQYCGDFQYVDTDRPYWHNDKDKIVLMVDLEKKSAIEKAIELVGFGKVAVGNSADEFDYELFAGQYLIIRMWWD